MPETAVYKNHCFVAGEDDVRSSGELAVVGGIDRETVAGAVKQTAQLNFGLGVFALDPRHVPGTALFCEVIGHYLGVRG